MTRDTRLLKKVYGCYALGAIGDTLGRPAEGTRSYEPLHRTALAMTQLPTRRTHEARARAAGIEAML
jgi:hypothetical protein